MSEPRRRDGRLLAEALRRGWIRPDALAAWFIEAAGATGDASVLDQAVERGLIDASQAAHLRSEWEPPLGRGAPRRTARWPIAAPDATTRPGRTLARSSDFRDGERELREASTAVPTTDERPRSPRSGAGDVRSMTDEAENNGVLTPVSLATLPGDAPFHHSADGPAGRYRIGEEIGRGGMGVIYTAHDKTLGRRVAMKTLRPLSADNPKLVRALIREAQTTGQLSHPGIVPVHELGVDDDGRTFYTMKLVSGVSLAEVLHRLRRGDPRTTREMTLVRRLSVFQQVCMAVHYAHSRGVIHRDLKPANILLGDFGEVQVLDWGIALIVGSQAPLGDGAGIADGPPEPQNLIGTPRYMSPEQASGNADGLDVRSDIFALGVILRELVTLAPPFGEPDTERTLERIRTESLPPPPERDSNGRPLPPELARIIVRATALDRRERYADARGLWRDIEELIEGRKERARRRRQARDAFREGKTTAERFRALQLARATLVEKLGEQQDRLSAWSPNHERDAAQRLAFRRENLDLVLARVFSDAAASLQRALADDPDNAPAREMLSRLYWERFAMADEARDLVAMTYFSDRAQQLDDGAAPEQGETEQGETAEPPTGRVSVRTFPEGATISVLSAHELEQDLGTPEGRPLGRAPLTDLRLPPGIRLLHARHAGYRDARQPVFVRAGGVHDALIVLQPWSSAVPMVGRDAELSQLMTAFEGTVRQRRTQLALVVGEPGMGRTRLQEAFSYCLEQRSDVIIFAFVHCLPIHQGVPFHALVELLRFRSGIRSGDAAAAVRTKLREMTRFAWIGAGERALGEAERRDACEVADLLGALPGFDLPSPEGRRGDVLRERVEAAMARYLRMLGKSWPITLLFKEMQRMDGTSRRFLRRFAETEGPTGPAGPDATRAGSLPCFILGGVTASGASGALHALGELPAQLRIDLAPLSPPATSQLVASLLKGAPDEELVSRIGRSARGNPYLIEELTQCLVQEGRVVSREGEWRLAAADAELVAVGVADFSTQRIRSLPDGERAVIAAAGVIGQEFWAEALEALDLKDVRRALDSLVRRELIEVRPHARFAGTREYGFRLEVAWRAAYGSLGGERTRDLHRRVAKWFEDRASGSFADRARLAVHYDGGWCFARAQELHAALARESAALGAHEEAVFHWDRALATPMPAERRRDWEEERNTAIEARAQLS